MKTIMRINYVGLTTLFLRELYRFVQIPAQTIVPPLLTSLLYILIFGQFLGSRIQEILPGVGYIDFMVPGLLMMNVISSAFMGSSFGIYITRFQNSIQEVLVAPLSYAEMGTGYVMASTIRGIVTGLGIYLIAIFFTSASIAHFWLFLYFLFATSFLFSTIGAIIGMSAKNFESINLPNTFIVLPLSFLGGVFHSVSLLPPTYALITKLNPIFYMVNGIRSSMIGVSDTNALFAAVIVGAMALIAFVWCVYLFSIGYKLKS